MIGITQPGGGLPGPVAEGSKTLTPTKLATATKSTAATRAPIVEFRQYLCRSGVCVERDLRQCHHSATATGISGKEKSARYSSMTASRQNISGGNLCIFVR